MIAAAPDANAQDQLEIRRQVVAELQQQLPLTDGQGMTLTKCDFTADGKTLIMTFEVDPVAMGTTLDAMKAELNRMTSSEFKASIGKDFVNLQAMFGCDVKFILELPDHTTKEFFFPI